MRVLACLILLASAVPASAQTKPGAMQKRAMASEEGHFIQLTGFGSFNLGKDLYRAGGAQLGLDDGGGWGGRVGYFTNPKLGFELSYARTSGDLKAREGDTAFPNPADLGELEVQQADLVAVLSGASDSKAKSQGYVVAGVGLTRFTGTQPVQTGSTQATRFAWIAGLGTKLRMGDKTGLRLEGRYRNTNTDNGDVLWTDGNGNPYTFANHWYRTWEISAGLALKL
jgi:hypothetical protein